MNLFFLRYYSPMGIPHSGMEGALLGLTKNWRVTQAANAKTTSQERKEENLSGKGEESFGVVIRRQKK